MSAHVGISRYSWVGGYFHKDNFLEWGFVGEDCVLGLICTMQQVMLDWCVTTVSAHWWNKWNYSVPLAIYGLRGQWQWRHVLYFLDNLRWFLKLWISEWVVKLFCQLCFRAATKTVLHLSCRIFMSQSALGVISFTYISKYFYWFYIINNMIYVLVKVMFISELLTLFLYCFFDGYEPEQAICDILIADILIICKEIH